RELPEWMQIWPGHRAPSDTSDVTGPFPAITSGDEKLVNWALAEMSEDEFVRAIVERRQEPPPYFTVLKRLNREGPPPRYAASAPTRMDAAALDAALAQASATVIDMRPAPQVASSGVPGALNVPYGREFAKTIGAQVPLTSDIWLIGTDDDGDLARQATNDLALIGFDRVVGWFTPDVPHEWERRVEH